MDCYCTIAVTHTINGKREYDRYTTSCRHDHVFARLNVQERLGFCEQLIVDRKLFNTGHLHAVFRSSHRDICKLLDFDVQ